MPITALPKATVQLLGSAQVLTTPLSLVKELIDNSLDAKATSIDILISKNTLEKIEVRDNGHGISSEDFNSLGRRGHTSKLRTFEELRLVGGVTLGFRGEALASAVQLGEVSIMTKTEGESVGTRLILKAPGIMDQTRTSHPVGTTVSVQKFMHKIPVRKKNFEKDAQKTLTKINQLLRSYALARPSIRFSLKVAGVAKASWSFAPRPHDGIKEAVSLVIGRDAAMECTEKTLVPTERQSVGVISGNDGDNPSFDEDCQADEGSFAVEAFIPKPGANSSNTGTGQYISIDSRPVSHEKGTIKKVVTLFKKYFRATFAEPAEKVKNPFIRLNIKCPIASYDANVEPAKDDVLFGNEYVVLRLAERLFKEAYGELQQVPFVTAPKLVATELDNFNLLLAGDPKKAEENLRDVSRDSSLISPQLKTQNPAFMAHESSSPTTVRRSSPMSKDIYTAGESSATEIEDSDEQQNGIGRRDWGFSMSNDLAETVDDGRQRGQSKHSFETPQRQTPCGLVSDTPLNPWTIAKTLWRTTQDDDVLGDRQAKILPSENSSSQLLFEPPRDDNRFAPPKTRTRQAFHSDDVQALQSSVSRRYSESSIRPQFEKHLLMDNCFPDAPLQRIDFVSARKVSDPALTPFPSVSKRRSKHRGPNQPFVSPLTTTENRASQPDRFVQTTLFGKAPRPRRQSDGDHVMLFNTSDQDLAWAMDFEHRKQDATRRRREENRAAQMAVVFSNSADSVRSHPHKNRYNAAIASLEAGPSFVNMDDITTHLQVQPKTALPDGDPRGYLMKRMKSAKKSAHGHPMIRAKSTRLPLENTPQADRLHQLVHNLVVNVGKLQTDVMILAQEDVYVRRGDQSAGLRINELDKPMLKTKLEEVVGLWLVSGGEKSYEVDYCFAV